jgi:hypothetical protein
MDTKFEAIRKRRLAKPQLGSSRLVPWLELVSTTYVVFGADAPEETIAKWVELLLAAEPEIF